jgi:hypothetical protein
MLMRRVYICVFVLFGGICSKVQSALQDVDERISRAEKLRTTQGQSADEVEPLCTIARVDMSRIRIDLKDLAQTIAIVEENRLRFPSIDNRELDSRRSFVMDAKASLGQHDEHLKRLQYMSASNPLKQFAASEAASRSHHGEQFVRQSQLSAHRQTEEEDKVILGMSQALDRLQHVGQDIHSEFVKQDVYVANFSTLSPPSSLCAFLFLQSRESNVDVYVCVSPPLFFVLCVCV